MQKKKLSISETILEKEEEESPYMHNKEDYIKRKMREKQEFLE